jgi:hypothetical protein
MKYLNKYKKFESDLYDDISNDIISRIPKNYSVEDLINYMRDRGSDDKTISEVFMRIKNKYEFSYDHNYKPSMKDKQILKRSNSFIKASEILSNVTDISQDLIDDSNNNIEIKYEIGQGSRFTLSNDPYMNILLYGDSETKYTDVIFKDICENLFEYISNEGLDCIIGLTEDGKNIEEDDILYTTNKNYRVIPRYSNETYGYDGYYSFIMISDKNGIKCS